MAFGLFLMNLIFAGINLYFGLESNQPISWVAVAICGTLAIYWGVKAMTDDC